MKLMGADPTCDQINDWFKIGTQVKVATIPQSQLGGYPLDPETGMAAVVNYRPVRAAYKRYSDVGMTKYRKGPQRTTKDPQKTHKGPQRSITG